jgi:hypothetical protein
MGGKSATSTSKVTIPPEVMARYNAVNARAEKAAATPYEKYGNSPTDFVAQMNAQQDAGINTINASGGPSYQNIDKYMSPYIKNVADTTGAMMRQQQEQAQSGALGSAISSGAFGGDRAGIAAANLQQQNQMAYGNTMANIYNQGYTQALGASQADLGRQLQVGQTQLAAGTLGQQTEQAGKDAMIKQFMQEKGYPFQVAQYLANIAMGTGAASGSTTTSTSPVGFFQNLNTGGRVGKDNGGGVAGPMSDSQTNVWGEGYVPAGVLPVGQLMVANPPDQQQNSNGSDTMMKLAQLAMGAKRGGVIDGRHGYAEGGGSTPLTPEEMEMFRRRQAILRDPSIDMPNTGTDTYQPHGNNQAVRLGTEAPPVQPHPYAGGTGYGGLAGGQRAEASLPTTPQTPGETISSYGQPIRNLAKATGHAMLGDLDSGLGYIGAGVTGGAGSLLSYLGGENYGGNYLMGLGSDLADTAKFSHEHGWQRANEEYNKPYISSVTSLPAQPTGVAPQVATAEPQGLTASANAIGAAGAPAGATGVMPINAQPQDLPARAGVAPPSRPMQQTSATDVTPAVSAGTYTGVSKSGPGWVDLVRPDGSVEHREGAANWRNNNPGNVEYGDFAKAHGAIGTDGRFAIFPDEQTGANASKDLIFNSPGYRGMTIEQALTKYSPPSENPTGAKIAAITAEIGLPPNTPMDQMTPQQQNAFMLALRRTEGPMTGDVGASRPYTTSTLGGVGGANMNAEPSQQLGGLAGNVKPYEQRNVIGKFFHNPDGSLNTNAIRSMIGGLGAMASSRSMSPITALLQGVAGGEETYRKLEKQAADIAQTQAATRQTDVATNAARFFKPEGGVAMVTLPSGDTVKYWDFIRDPSMQANINPEELTRIKTEAAAAGVSAPADNSGMGSIFTDPTGQEIINREASRVEGPGYDTAIQRSAEIRDEVNNDASAAMGLHDTTVEQARAVSSMLSGSGLNVPGAAGSARAQIVKYANTILSSLGLSGVSVGEGDTDADILGKIRAGASLAAAQGADQSSVEALKIISSGMPNENITPEANAAIMANIMVSQKKAIDKEKLYADYSTTNPYGTVFGASSMFSRMNQKYDMERDALQRLMQVGGTKGTDGVSVIERLTSGTLSPEDAQGLISAALGGNAPEEMYMYFIPYQAG